MVSVIKVGSTNQWRIGIIGSAGGSVFAEGFGLSSSVRSRVGLVASDRHCGLTDFAVTKKIPFSIINGRSNVERSDQFLSVLVAHNCNLVISFYTRMFEGQIVDFFKGRFLNFHPSILPAHPGMHGFEDALRSDDDYLGATVHMVDSTMDGGPIIMQSSFLNNRALSINRRQDMVFKLQVSQFVSLCESCDDIFGDNKN